MPDNEKLEFKTNRPARSNDDKAAFLDYLKRLGRMISWCLIITLIGLSVGTAFVEGRRSLAAVVLPLLLCAIPGFALFVLRPGRSVIRRDRHAVVQPSDKPRC